VTFLLGTLLIFSSPNLPGCADLFKDQIGLPDALSVLRKWKYFRDLENEAGRVLGIPTFRKRLPAQPVHTTPSNSLIQRYFPYVTDLLGCASSYLTMVVLFLNQRSPRALAIEIAAIGLRAADT
jgi:hypothetical protein